MEYYTIDDEEDAIDALDDSGTASREHMVFLVDANSIMFQPLTDKRIKATSLFDLSLRVCIDIIRSRIIDSPNDEVSVIFYGTKNKRNESGFEYVYVYLDLQPTDVQRIAQMCEITDENFDERIGIHKDSESIAAESLKLALWTSMDIIDDKLKTAKTVLLFTANDNPCTLSAQTQEQVLNRVEQMRAARIHLRLFLLPYAEFQPSITFWRDVNEHAKISDEVDDFDEDVLQRLESLVDDVRKKIHPKRAIASLTMTIIKDLTCTVKLYSLVRQATKGKVLKLDARTHEELVSSTAYICNDTGAKLEEIEELSFQPQRADSSRYPPLVMKKEDVVRLKQGNEEPGIRILGFQPLTALMDHHQLCPSLFVFPDEHTQRGSTTMFIALHETMLRSRSIAICQYSKTQNCQTRIAALLPQQETRDEDDCQICPPGLHLITLPFMDDIRYPELDSKIVGDTFHYADVEQLTAAEAVIQALTLPDDYTTIDISNPHLQRHYQAVEALALNEQLPDMDAFVDGSMPDIAAMQKHKDIILAFKDSVYGDQDEEAIVAASGKKRRLAEPNEDIRAIVSRINWRDLAKADELDTLTVEILKKYLAFHQLPLSGRKADLITRIKAHLAD